MAGSSYYSLVMHSDSAVASPPVELQEGTAGDSTIYTNGTSAKVSVDLNGTGVTDVEDYVDNNTTDVDSSSDKGAHSNFTAEQYGPDSINDTLTEVGVPITYEYIWISGGDDYVRKLDKSDPGGTEVLSWDTGTSSPFGCEFRIVSGTEYIYVADFMADLVTRYFAVNGSGQTTWDISGFSGDAYGLAWNGSKWFVADRSDDRIYGADWGDASADMSFYHSSIAWVEGLAYDGTYLWAADTGTDLVYKLVIPDSGFDVDVASTAEFDFTDPAGIAYDTASGHLWIVSSATDLLYEYYTNGTQIDSWDPSGADPEGVAYASIDDTSYQLDLEVQWTNADYDEPNEELCIYGGLMGAENITVDVWNGTGWENLFNDLDSGWNNVSVSSYLDSSNFTIRFKGGTETGDTTQTSWNIDATVLHVWTEADVEDFVDNNTSDMDNSTDIGTHSNFTAQQYGPDSVNDTLTEENTGGNVTLWLYVNADDETRTGWERVGTNPYLDAIDYPTNFVDAEGNNLEVGDFNFTDSGKSTEPISTVEVQLNAMQSQIGNNLEVFVWDGSSWTSLGVQTTPTSWGWMNWTATTELDTWTKIDAAKIYIVSRAATGTFEVDCARLKVDYTEPANYELDLEVQWTNVDYDEPNEKLCIYGGLMGAENITVNVWNGSSWENLFSDLDSGWNNVSVSSYLDSSNFTIRFRGGTETGDTTQTSWNIDATVLHVWTEGDGDGGGQADFNYVLKIIEKQGSNWQIRLKAYDQSNISRLDNCSIYIYDGSNSTQIVILNGDYENQTGPWIDLNASDTEYIWMHVETSSAGTSRVYVYLEIRVPNKTVYARYVILFEIN